MAYASAVALVEQGATVIELSKMFAMDPRDVRSRLKEVHPDGTRGDVQYYAIRNAAPYLVPIAEGDAAVVKRILKMNSNALPAVLKKEFWAGQLAELRVMELQSNLWPTKAVVDLASATFKTLRQSLVLMNDALDRESGLTEQQRAIISFRIDATLEELRSTLIDDLERSKRANSGATVTQEEDGPIEDL